MQKKKDLVPKKGGGKIKIDRFQRDGSRSLHARKNSSKPKRVKGGDRREDSPGRRIRIETPRAVDQEEIPSPNISG